MTTDPPRRRGRGPSPTTRATVLDTAADLLDERGWPGFTVDEVARRSTVSKATVYKHWSGGFALAIEAYGRRATQTVPTLDTGDAVTDLVDQAVRLARFYRSNQGRTAAQLLGAAAHDQDGPALVRRHFFGPRRQQTLHLVLAAVARGELRGDVDPELMIDLVFGPIVFRRLNGLDPLTDEQASTTARLALSSLARSSGRRPAADPAGRD